MGLVQNLKKTLNNWVDKILVAESCHYIRHLAKQTTRKQDNSSTTTSSQSHLTSESPSTTIVTSSADTSEKITMMETEDLVVKINEWAMDRFLEPLPTKDCLAIYQEFQEWLEPHGEDLEVITLDEISEEEYEDFIERG
jgi:hypothetical protein